MKRTRRWLAALLCILVLADGIPAQGAQAAGSSAYTSETQEKGREKVQDPRGGMGDSLQIPAAGEAAPDDHDPKEEQPGEETYSKYQLTLSLPKKYMESGETQQLKVETNAPRKELKYESENPSIATVSSNGLVTAVSGGEAGTASVGIKVSCINPKNPQDMVSEICYVTVKNTISLNKKSFTVYLGQKTVYQLKAASKPQGAITWKSSKTSVATVNQKGVITPKKEGKTKIIVTAGGVTASCEVTVKKPSLSLSSKKTIYINHPAALSAQASPKAKISWSTSDSKIASVNSKGVVTGKKPGTVTITAKANGITKKCKVTVKKPTIRLTDNLGTTGKTTSIFQGSSLQLTATAKPAAKVKWKSSNPKVAKVDGKGKVTGIKEGTVTITASVPGAKTAWKVRVVKSSYKLNFTSRTMMAGSQATLFVKNLPEYSSVSFSQTEYNGSISLYSSGRMCTITANRKGKETIWVNVWVYLGAERVLYRQSCTIKVVDSGINAQQVSIAKNTSQKLKVVNGGKGIKSVTWSSSEPKVVSVDKQTGKVTGKKAGTAKITATITYSNGKKKTYTTTMKVSNPALKTTTISLALNSSKTIGVKGTNGYTSIRWKSKKESVVTVDADGKITPKKKGSAQLTATVDGKKLTCRVYVTDPKLKSSYSALSPGGKASISLKGLSSKSKVTYKSSNPWVASVNKSGKITAVGGGRSEITVNADGRELHYLVEVASSTALQACKEGKAIMFSSSYSQALRMSTGYYDCSSLVFRAYGRNTGLLGGQYSWAPTAAGMAMHMANTGKVLYWGQAKVEDLRPGDLIFYGGASNGRYLGIYHVSMYYGNGYRLEKPMYGYFPNEKIVMIARPVP